MRNKLGKQFVLRTGQKFQDFGGLAAGMGFRLGNLTIDYAYSSYGEMGNTNRAGLTYSFGSRSGER